MPNGPQNMKSFNTENMNMKNNLYSKNISPKDLQSYDNTGYNHDMGDKDYHDNIINNPPQHLMNGPFYIYSSSNPTGNLYGNLSVVNMNTDMPMLNKKQNRFINDTYTHLLNQYTSVTSTLVQSNYNQKSQNQNINDLDNEKTIACMLNMQLNQQNDISLIVNDLKLLRESFENAMKFYNDLKFHITYPELVGKVNNFMINEEKSKKTIFIKIEEIEKQK